MTGGNSNIMDTSAANNSVPRNYERTTMAVEAPTVRVTAILD